MSKATTVHEAERNAEAARNELSATLDMLRDALTPRQLAGEAVAATRARTPNWLLDYYGFAISPSGIGLISAAAASISLTVLKRKKHRERRFAR